MYNVPLRRNSDYRANRTAFDRCCTATEIPVYISEFILCIKVFKWAYITGDVYCFSDV